MTALRVRCWGVIRSELCIDHLLEEHREVSADTGLPRGRESIPDLGWIAGHSTSHCSARETSSDRSCALITSWKSTVRSARIRVCHAGESRFQTWVGLQDIAPRIAQLEKRAQIGVVH